MSGKKSGIRVHHCHVIRLHDDPDDTTMSNNLQELSKTNENGKDLSNPESFQTNHCIIFPLIDKIDKSAVPPLEHTAVGQEKVPHADLQFGPRFLHDAIISFCRIIPDINVLFLPWAEWSGYAPGKHPGSVIDIHDSAAVGNRTSA
jgi:hypothetical protein